MLLNHNVVLNTILFRKRPATLSDFRKRHEFLHLAKRHFSRRVSDCMRGHPGYINFEKDMDQVPLFGRFFGLSGAVGRARMQLFIPSDTSCGQYSML